MPRPSPSRSRARPGFTLIELTVAVVILAIVAALVLPSVIGMSDLKVRSAARRVAANLEYAQSQAIASNTPVIVSFDPAANSYTLIDSYTSQPLDHPMTKSAFTEDLDQLPGMQGVSIVSASFSGSPLVTFQTLGSPSSAGTIVLAAGAETLYVKVAPVTGRVTVSGTP